jgi:hypothetical protein
MKKIEYFEAFRKLYPEQFYYSTRWDNNGVQYLGWFFCGLIEETIAKYYIS